jgi:uncharacterized membrane protein YeaQ/YmgE (transglycosylase-associated protein family)
LILFLEIRLTGDLEVLIGKSLKLDLKETIMGIIWSIIIGFIVGLIAKFLMPGKDPAGFIITTLLGIGGAVLGKYIGQGIGLYHEGQPAGFFMSIIGAMIILFIYHYFTKDKIAS